MILRFYIKVKEFNIRAQKSANKRGQRTTIPEVTPRRRRCGVSGQLRLVKNDTPRLVYTIHVGCLGWAGDGSGSAERDFEESEIRVEVNDGHSLTPRQRSDSSLLRWSMWNTERFS